MSFMTPQSKTPSNIWYLKNKMYGRLLRSVKTWLLRDIRLFGGVFLTKTESISRCFFPASFPNKPAIKISQITDNRYDEIFQSINDFGPVQTTSCVKFLPVANYFL